MNFITTLLAECDPVIGCITPPRYIGPGIDPITGKLTGMMTFLNSLLRLLFVGAGLFAFTNIILAGFAFMSAGGDPKNITKAWEKIWQSIVGLLIIVISFILAAVIGLLLFNDIFYFLTPRI